jgi:hypothetical protein
LASFPNILAKLVKFILGGEKKKKIPKFSQLSCPKQQQFLGGKK